MTMLYRLQRMCIKDRCQRGDMSNKGIEVMLNLDVIRNKSFNWNTSINLSHNKNEITKLSNDLFQQAVFM